MTVPQHIVERVSHLRAEQAHWEGMRQQAAARLLEHANRAAESGIDAGLHYDSEAEQLRSQLTTALFHFQEIGQELTHIREQLEADAREATAQDPEALRQELVKRDDARNEQLAKEAAEQLEALRKEEAQKAAALDKEQRDKEFFEKKDADRLEAAAKEEKDKEAIAKEERDKQEALSSQQSDLELLADINEEWQSVLDEIQSEWDYIDEQIHEVMEYNVSQTLDVISEVGFEVGKAFANSISSKEADQFLDTQRQALLDYVAGEVFQTAPTEQKGQWLEEKFKEQLQTEQATFGRRNDDNDLRDVMREGLNEMHDTLRKAVAQERQIETEVNDKAKVRDELFDQTKERIEKSGAPPEVAEERTKRLEIFNQQQEQKERDDGEKNRQSVWEEAVSALKDVLAAKDEQAKIQEAEQRKEAERARQDFGREL